MPITDATYTLNPPLYHAHQHDAGTDLLDDLNDWALSLFSPLYSPTNPAFALDGTGALLANQNGRMTLSIPDTYWIVFSTSGSISRLDPASFAATYSPEG